MYASWSKTAEEQQRILPKAISFFPAMSCQKAASSHDEATNANGADWDLTAYAVSAADNM